jgi:tripartite ATP-independent transporter DctP family solute receptor
MGLALTMALALQTGGAAAQSLQLRMSSEDPPASPLPVMARKFGEELQSRIPDAAIEMFDTGALGDEVVHMQMVRTGQIQIYPMGSDAVALDPAWAIFDMPFLFRDYATAYAALDGALGEALTASMRKAANLQVLAFGEIGFRQITNNIRAVVVPADLSGVRLRVPGSPTRILAFQSLGASPVTMNFGELYLALQNGTVDGQENPLSLISSQSFFEVQKHLSISNHVYTPVTFVMNGAAYDALTDAQRTAVHEAARAAAAFSREQGQKSDAELIGKLGASMQVSQIDVAAFQAAARPIWDEIAKVAGAEIAQQAIASATGQ